MIHLILHRVPDLRHGLPLIDQTRIFPLRKSGIVCYGDLDGLYPRSSPDVVGAPAMLSDVRVFPHHLGPSMTVAKSIRSLPDTCQLCMACLPTPLCWIAVDHCNFWQIPISILGKFRCEFLANSNVNSWKIPLLVRRGQSPALIVSASPETSSSVIPMVGK